MTNTGNETIPAFEYIRPYQNGESLDLAMFLINKGPDDYDMVPFAGHMEPGKSAELIVYHRVKKNEPIEFRDVNWMLSEAQGMAMDYWTWQPT